MNRWLPILVALLLVPVAAAQADARVRDLRATPGNQFVDLRWDPPLNATNVTGYLIVVKTAGQADERIQRPDPATSYRHFGVNGRTYTFTVAPVYGNYGNFSVGPESDPVSVTPSLADDLQYLEAGLVMTWLGLLGYGLFLARREALIDRKLEQLDAHRPPRPK